MGKGGKAGLNPRATKEIEYTVDPVSGERGFSDAEVSFRAVQQCSERFRPAEPRSGRL
jgi:hypothetical protein